MTRPTTLKARPGPIPPPPPGPGTLEVMPGSSNDTTVAFLGPAGTFTEEALRSQVDLAGMVAEPYPSFPEVLDAVEDGAAGYGFVAIENSIEGTVPVTMDQLIFERELFIVSEAVLPVTQNLLTMPGARLEDLKAVLSFPHATGQCQGWLRRNLPGVETVAASSTAEAVRQVAEAHDGSVAAIGTVLAASLYGLQVLAHGIEDHPDNATRFVLVCRPDLGVPAPTGHDKTTIVCFQFANHPGSLHSILGQFAARDLNLVKLESRPTKKGLGDYCFVIDVEGHIDDEMVADCLRNLHAELPQVKFLGSYPAAGSDAAAISRQMTEKWHAADRWVADLRSHVRGQPAQ